MIKLPLAAGWPLDDLEVLATMLRMTVPTLTRSSARVKTPMLVAQERNLLVADEALVFHVALAYFMTFQAVGDTFEVCMRRRKWTW